MFPAGVQHEPVGAGTDNLDLPVDVQLAGQVNRADQPRRELDPVARPTGLRIANPSILTRRHNGFAQRQETVGALIGRIIRQAVDHVRRQQQAGLQCLAEGRTDCLPWIPELLGVMDATPPPNPLVHLPQPVDPS